MNSRMLLGGRRKLDWIILVWVVSGWVGAFMFFESEAGMLAHPFTWILIVLYGAIIGPIAFLLPIFYKI